MPYQFCKNYELIEYHFSLVQILVFILIQAILEQSVYNKMEIRILVGMSTTNIHLHL